MKLGTNQRCPIHHRLNCCGRESVLRPRQSSKWEHIRPGVSRIWDELLGKYRWRLSPAERRKVMDRRIKEQGGLCAICQKELADYRDVVPDHIEPKGMGGSRHDDGENGSNLQATHWKCNMEKGSRRI